MLDNLAVVLLDSLNRHMLGAYGSIESWEEPITVGLRKAGVTTMLATDHPPLFEKGGENYHTGFFGWDYVRGHEGDPRKTYRDRWMLLPVHIAGVFSLARPDGRAWLDHMPGSEIPVLRQPFQPGDPLPFWVGRGIEGTHHLYDLDVDPEEHENRAGEKMETDLLRSALQDVEAPPKPLKRSGLT